MAPGSFSCDSPHIPEQSWLRLPGLEPRFLRRTAPSYARVDVLVGEAGRFAAFLEAPPAVASLRLRTRVTVTGASWAGALLWAGKLVGAELQLSGEEVLGALLAERLAGDVEVVRCILFASVKGGSCGLVAEAGGHEVKVKECWEDLGSA